MRFSVDTPYRHSEQHFKPMHDFAGEEKTSDIKESFFKRHFRSIKVTEMAAFVTLIGFGFTIFDRYGPERKPRKRSK